MGSLEELHSGRDRSYIVAGWAIIIGTLEEGYFQPPILLHSLPMDTSIIRLVCVGYSWIASPVKLASIKVDGAEWGAALIVGRWCKSGIL